MSEQRIVIKVDRLNPAVAWMAALSQAVGSAVGRTGNWAASTAQKSAGVVAILMGPAVLSVYAFAVWSLTSEMGWTDSFPFTSGPLSNWMIWAALAAAIHCAAVILRKQKDRL
jgi:propanediol dehydratase large subunit